MSIKVLIVVDVKAKSKNEVQSILDLVTNLVSRKSVTKSRHVTKSMYIVNPNPYRGGRTGNLLCINPLSIDYFCVIQLTSYPKTNIESYIFKFIVIFPPFL